MNTTPLLTVPEPRKRRYPDDPFYGHDFRPPYCPNSSCPAHPLPDPAGPGWGRFYWKDGRSRSLSHPEGVQRYVCRSCRMTFNRRAFELEYREKKPIPTLNALVFGLHNAGLPHREIARKLGYSEPMVRGRLKKMAKLGMLLHQWMSGDVLLREPIVYDGLENFAGSQYDPNQIQQAVGQDSLFIYDFNFIPLNRKGRMSPRQKRIKRAIEAENGPYPKRAIRTATAEIFRRLIERKAPQGPLRLFTDKHFQYRRAMNEDLAHLRSQVEVTTISSKDSRTFQNVLFAVNHMDLLTRHRSAAFTRETISFSKTHQSMIEKYVLFMMEKNYIRPQFVKKHKRRPLAHDQSPAVALGITPERLDFAGLYALRILPDQVKLNREWRAYYDEVETYPRVGAKAA